MQMREVNRASLGKRDEGERKADKLFELVIRDGEHSISVSMHITEQTQNFTLWLNVALFTTRKFGNVLSEKSSPRMSLIHPPTASDFKSYIGIYSH